MDDDVGQIRRHSHGVEWGKGTRNENVGRDMANPFRATSAAGCFFSLGFLGSFFSLGFEEFGDLGTGLLRSGLVWLP